MPTADSSGSVAIGSTVLPGIAYYADATNGHDYNDGLSPISAFKTIAALTAADAASNRAYWCLSGQFREQVTVPRNNMTVAYCGWGTQPMLDASDAIPAASWSLVSGKTNCYQATVAIVGQSGKTTVNSYENGAVLARVADTATCDSTASSTAVSSDVAVGNITLYVHLAGDVNPATKADGWVEYTHRQAGLDARNVTGTLISGIWTRRNLHNDGSLIIGKASTAKNVYTTDGNLHSIYLRTGSTLDHYECYNRYNTTEDSYVVYNEDTPAGEGITISNGYIHGPAYDAKADGIYGHVNTSGNFGAVALTNNKVALVNRAIHLESNTATITITGGTLDSSLYAVRSEGLGTVTITGLTITNQHAGGQNLYLANSGAGFVITGLVTSNLVSDAVFANSTNSTVSLTNSTLGAAAGMVAFNAGGGTFTASGNTYGAITDHFYQFASTTTVNSDFNTFKNPTGRGIFAFQVNGANDSWAVWQALPQDAHSTAN